METMPGYQEVRTLSTNTLSLHQPSARLRVLAFSFPRIDHTASHPLVIGASPIPLPAAVSITLLKRMATALPRRLCRVHARRPAIGPRV